MEDLGSESDVSGANDGSMVAGGDTAEDIGGRDVSRVSEEILLKKVIEDLIVVVIDGGV